MSTVDRTARISRFSQYKALVAKDIRLEMKTRKMITSMAVYAVLVLTIYGAALSQTGDAFDVLQVASGLLWALILFTSLLGLNRSFANETENRSLDAILLAPLDRALIFLGKASSNLLFMLVVEVLTVPLFFFFFLGGVQVGPQAVLMILPLIVGTIGIAGVGTLLATITMNTQGKDILLAILLIPVIFPLLYACVAATSVVLVGVEGQLPVFWRSLVIAGGYDVIMVAASYALYEFVVSA